MSTTQDLFGCNNVKDIKIPEGGNVNFFNPAENTTTKIRFLKGPKIHYLYQEWSKDRKPIGEKKYYDENEVNLPSEARIMFSYIIYNYNEDQIQTWDIGVKSLLKSVKAINDLNPQLSSFDCNVTKKKGSNGFMEYTLVNGAPSVFDNQAIIDKFVEEKPFEKLVEAIEKKIEETKNGGSLENEEKQIEAEIAAKKEATNSEVSIADAEEAFK